MFQLSNAHRRMVLVGALLVPLVIFFLLIISSAKVVVCYVSDDFYYYLQVARHIALGDGPTFDGLTWTTGFHPLYAFILAAVDLVGHPGRDLFVSLALLINGIAFFITSYVIYHIVSMIWNDQAGFWASIFWLSNPNAVLMPLTGMEGSVYACCVAFFILYLFKMVRFPQTNSRMLHAVQLGVWGGLCLLARTDSLGLILLSGAALPWFIEGTLVRRITKAAVFVAIALSFMLFYLVYIYCYTGMFVQGSAEMKMFLRMNATMGMSSLEKLLFGFNLFFHWTIKNIFKVPILKFVFPWFLVCGLKPNVIRLERSSTNLIHLLWLFPVLLGVAYATFLPKAYTWYYAPCLVMLTVLAAGCFHTARAEWAVSNLQRTIIRWMPVILALTAIESYGYLGLKLVRGRNIEQIHTLEFAHYLQDTLPPHSRVGCWNSGIISWYTDHQVVNLDGLINNDIPRLWLEGKSVCEYIEKLDIDFVVDNYAYLKKNCLDSWEEAYETHIYNFYEYDKIQDWEYLIRKKRIR